MNGRIAAVSDSWKSINLVTGGSSGSGLSVPLAGDPATWEQLQSTGVYSVQSPRSRDRRDLLTIDVSGSWLTAATLSLFLFVLSLCPF